MDTTHVPATDSAKTWQLLFAAWTIALVSTLAVLFVGEVLGHAPCVLCWFQRAFMFPLVVVLGVACWRSDAQAWRYALPLALVGGAVAVYHTALFFGFVPEEIKPCTATGPSCSGDEMTLFGFVPIPLLSVGAFGALAGLLLLVRKGSSS